MAVVEKLRGATAWLQRNLFFFVVLVAGPLVLLYVPQVFNIWYSEPPPTDLSVTWWLGIWWLFAAFLAVAGLFFAASVYVVPRPDVPGCAGPQTLAGASTSKRGVIRRLMVMACSIVDRIVSIPVDVVDWLPSPLRFVVGVLVLIGGAILVLSWLGVQVESEGLNL